jgi:outer membrane protein with beta-barrel domain
MGNRIGMSLVAFLVFLGTAYGQELGAGAGRFEVGAFPGGGMFFTESDSGGAPDFGNYALGASLTVNVNRWVGFEGDGGGTIGVRQNFKVGATPFAEQRTPSMWTYSGNVIVNPAGSNRSVVPYATVGIGGLTLCPCGDVDNLGITTYDTYLTGNVGGGVRWFSARHFGVRGDYRFFVIRNKDTAPMFLGNETRYGHRVQAGLVFTY